MQRPASYNTKHGEAVLAYLESKKDTFVTAAQIAEYLEKKCVAISRPTVYRQLEKLIWAGKAEKRLFGDSSVFAFRYVDPDEYRRDSYHLKCGICDGIFGIKCGEVDEVSRHIFESHEFQVDGTVFYGKCKTCLQDGKG